MNKIFSVNRYIFLFTIWIISCKHAPYYPEMDYPEMDYPEMTGSEKACLPDIIYFEKDVQPLLLSSCAYSGCHDAASAKDGVVLDTYENVIRTGEVVPYNPEESELYESLFERGYERMPPPPYPALSQAEKDLLRDWIGQGAENFTCQHCDTAVFTFSNSIYPIVESYCFRCHNDSRMDGGVNLEGYMNVKSSVDNQSLWGTINNINAYPLMPPGASLPDCEIVQIRKWIENLAPDD